MGDLTMIPVVDFEPWLGTATPLDPMDVSLAQKQVADDILNALSSPGAFILRNSGLVSSEVDGTIAFIEQFIHLPMETKLLYKRQSDKIFGYYPEGASRVNQQREEDLVEALLFQPQFMSGKNWPESELPGICKLVTEFMTKCYDLAMKLLWNAGLALNQTSNDMVTRGHSQTGGESTLRFNYFAPVPQEVDVSKIRYGEHTDYGTLTLHMGRQLEGLQIQMKSGDWVDVVHQPGDLLVNAGELLERWSDGCIRACLHRVKLPEGDDKKKGRATLPYYFAPDDSFVIANIANDSKFPPVETEAYMDRKFNRDHKVPE